MDAGPAECAKRLNPPHPAGVQNGMQAPAQLLQNSRTDPELMQSSHRALQNPEGFNPPYLPQTPRIAPVWRSKLFWFSTFFPTCFLARFSENPGSPKVAKKH